MLLRVNFVLKRINPPRHLLDALVNQAPRAAQPENASESACRRGHSDVLKGFRRVLSIVFGNKTEPFFYLSLSVTKFQLFD